MNEPTNILIFQDFADPSRGNVYFLRTMLKTDLNHNLFDNLLYLRKKYWIHLFSRYSNAPSWVNNPQNVLKVFWEEKYTFIRGTTDLWWNFSITKLYVIFLRTWFRNDNHETTSWEPPGLEFSKNHNTSEASSKPKQRNMGTTRKKCLHFFQSFHKIKKNPCCCSLFSSNNSNILYSRTVAPHEYLISSFQGFLICKMLNYFPDTRNSKQFWIAKG